MGEKIEYFSGEAMSDSLVKQAVALDRSVYPREYWLDENIAAAYLHACPSIYTCAVCGTTLVGYLNMSCIDESSYRTLLKGEQNDLCIGAENLCVPQPGRDNYLYFSSIVVDTRFRGKGVARGLFACFGEKLARLRSRGILFSDVIAEAVSIHGERLCRAFGMTVVKKTACGGTLFRFPMKGSSADIALESFIEKLKGGR